jgi:hypothetical protein
MNCLAPLITQLSPSRRAAVAMFPASEPPEGSVRPNETKVSPAAACLIRSSRSARPAASLASSAALMACTCTVTASEESTAARSSIAMQSVLRSAPAPSGSGTRSPNTPRPGDRADEVGIESSLNAPAGRLRGHHVERELADGLAPGAVLVGKGPGNVSDAITRRLRGIGHDHDPLTSTAVPRFSMHAPGRIFKRSLEFLQRT